MRKIFILFLSVFCLQQAFAAADAIRLEFDHFAQGPQNAAQWSLAHYEEWCNIRYNRCNR